MESINDLQLEDKVLNSKGLTVIDFWAEWCGPCRQLLPIMEEVSKEMGDKVKIYKMNVDESPESAAKFGIRSIPSVFLFKDGKQVDVRVGLNSKETMVSWIKEHM